MTEQPTGTVTFLFTDVEGSTRMWEESPDTMEATLARHDEILRQQITSVGGYVFTTAGDAFAAAFTDPRDALAAAIDTQLALQAEEWDVEDVRVRMSLHAGIAHEREGDYFGPTLNRGARILSAGYGGQVLASQSTHDLVGERLPDEVTFKPLGEHRLKDLGTPERLFQLAHPGLQSEFPTLKTLDAHLNNLPVELSSFIGRVDELNETVKRLADSRLVTLTGVGGSGKTRLALQTAAEVFDEYPDGVWVAAMAGLAEPERFPHWVAEEMGIARSGGSNSMSGAADERSWIEVVIDYLEPRTSLLVLDNCEHLIRAAAEFADRVLRQCSSLKILTTSREGLGVPGEYLIQVPSLSLPSMFDESGSDGAYPDAMELFAERASAVNARLELNTETAPSIADICRRLDGMPLAIELAAARTRMLTVDQIAERLSDAFRLLTGGSRTALPRQQTLLATVDWSYNLLEDSERLLFDRLAVFRGGFTLESAEAVVGGEGVDEFEIFDLLASLVDKSMILGGAESGRFRLLETLRQYALGKLTDSGEGERWRQRHAEHFANVADSAFEELRGPGQAEWMQLLEDDHDNLRAAFTWAVESGNYEIAGRIAAGVWWFWVSHAHHKQALEYWELLRPHYDDLPERLVVQLETGRTYLVSFDTNDSIAVPAALENAERAEKLGDSELLGHALLSAGFGYMQGNEHEEGLDVYERAREAYASAGYEWGLGWATVMPGWIYRMKADTETADEWLERSKVHFRAAGTQQGLAWVLTIKGIMHRYEFDYEGSIDAHREALELFRILGDRNAISFSHMTIAISLERLGRFEEAIEAAERGMALARDTGNLGAEEHSILAGVYRQLDRLEESHTIMTEVKPLLETTNESNMIIVSEEAADLAIALGEYELAGPLITYAKAARVRVDRPVPGPRLEERGKADAILKNHLSDLDSRAEEWEKITKDEAAALVIQTLDDLGAILAAAEATPA